jgi:hypothetical protein
MTVVNEMTDVKNPIVVNGTPFNSKNILKILNSML